MFKFLILIFSLFSFTLSAEKSLFELNQPVQILPSNVSEIMDIVTSNKKISLVGANKSQGGQTIYPGSIRLNLSKLNKLINLDVKAKKVTVQSGMTWSQLQQVINPYGLSIKAMQSYKDFSIGGSLSVNVHGRDVTNNPLIKSVDSFKIIMHDGQILHASRTENSQLFSLVIGGYGLFGIVTEVTLNLTDDVILERSLNVLNSKDFVSFFYDNIKFDPTVHFYSVRFSMDKKNFMDKALVLTYKKSNKDKCHLFNLNSDFSLKSKTLNSLSKKAFKSMSKSLFVKNIRFSLESVFFKFKKYVSRNNFMNVSLKGLPEEDSKNIYILQEYFIPYSNVNKFIDCLKTITNTFAINILNITARHVNADKESFLAYSPVESCAFVLYIHVNKNDEYYSQIQKYTTNLIDAALSLNGIYYLPYQLLASKEQLNSAYPQFKEFVSLKKQYDPNEIFVNNLYNFYI